MLRRAAGFFAAVLLSVSAVQPSPVPPPAPPPAPAPAPEVPAGPAPHLAFDSTEVQLGDVLRGEDAVATFTYHNTGKAPLHILTAKPG